MKCIYKHIRQALWFIALLTIASATQAQNLSVTFNGSNTQTAQASLQAAVTACGISLGSITEIEITAGDFTTADWNYLKANRKTLNTLAKFTITNGIGSVADVPDTDYNNPYFNKTSLQEISVDKVVIIGEWAFSCCGGLTSVSLPVATTIGERAFRFCRALTSVSLPVATTIGEWAFANCVALTTISLPMATTIGKRAFHDCDALSAVSLPMATTIGPEAFKLCTILYNISLPATPPAIANANAFDNNPTPRQLNIVDASGNALTGTALSNAQTAYKAVDDGNTADNLWYGWDLDMLPNTITLSVNSGASISGFNLSDALAATGVALGSITEIKVTAGDFTTADWDCLRINTDNLNTLAKFTITNGIGSVADIPNADGYNPYFNKTSLQEISVDKVLTIGYYAFKDCKALTSVNLPMVTAIKPTAFRDCKALSSINLPVVTTISHDAFAGCAALSAVSLPVATTIKPGVFYECVSLSSVSIPVATTIGAYTSSSCDALSTISAPKITEMKGVFEGCKALTSVSLPAATTIGYGAFKNCTSLNSISLPAVPPTVDNSEPSLPVFGNTPTPKQLYIVDASGNALTGMALNDAQTAYKAVDDGDTTDDLWYDWDIYQAVTSVSLNISNKTMNVGMVYQLIATVLPAASNQNITWSSDNSAVASVDANGLVSGLSIGDANITVTTEDGGFTASCTVTVTQPVSGITLNVSNRTMNVGMVYQLIATVLPANANNQNITWSSDNSAVASVDANGLVSGLSIGDANITVTTEDGGFTQTCQIRVNAEGTPYVPVSNWAILLGIVGIVGFSLLRLYIK